MTAAAEMSTSKGSGGFLRRSGARYSPMQLSASAGLTAPAWAGSHGHCHGAAPFGTRAEYTILAVSPKYNVGSSGDRISTFGVAKGRTWNCLGSLADGFQSQNPCSGVTDISCTSFDRSSWADGSPGLRYHRPQLCSSSTSPSSCQLHRK